MNKIKYLIKNGHVVNPNDEFIGDIEIENGVITEVKRISNSSNNAKGKIRVLPYNEFTKSFNECFIEIDASYNYIFPGFIDPHVHPGLPEDLGFFKDGDDFYFADEGAVTGGTTHFIDFAEQSKGNSICDAIIKREERYYKAKRCSHSYHGAVTEYSEGLFEDLKKAKEMGINSIKLYTTYGMKLSNEDILKVMKIAKELDLTVLVHCEDDAIINYCSKEDNYIDQRPKQAEAVIIYTMLSYAELIGCKVYICHISTKEGVEILRHFKRKMPGRVFGETCPQYICFTNEVYHREDMGKYLLSPPLRDADDREEIIKAVLDGTIDVISTDHCGYLYDKHKKPYINDISKMAKGIPGIELRASLCFQYLYIERGISLKNLIRVLSSNAAKIFNLSGFGEIKEGYKGGIVIWDHVPYSVTFKNLKEGSDYSPYEGLTLKGKPYITIGVKNNL